MTSQNIAIEKYLKTTAAGIFNIINGASCLLGVLGLVIAAIAITPLDLVTGLPLAISALLMIIAVPLAMIGTVSVVGGKYASAIGGSSS
jgi:hypothetical protein